MLPPHQMLITNNIFLKMQVFPNVKNRGHRDSTGVKARLAWHTANPGSNPGTMHSAPFLFPVLPDCQE